MLTGMEVFKACYERVGLGWVFAPVGWPVVGPLVEGAYRAFARVRTDLTRGRSLDALLSEHDGFEWDGFERSYIGGLKRPLLVAKGCQGFAACGYVDVATADKLDEACVIFTGVNSCSDFLTSEVQRVSTRAEGLGIAVGMAGKDALERLR